MTAAARRTRRFLVASTCFLLGAPTRLMFAVLFGTTLVGTVTASYLTGRRSRPGTQDEPSSHLAPLGDLDRTLARLDEGLPPAQRDDEVLPSDNRTQTFRYRR